MARQQLTQFIPKQADQFFADQKNQRIASLVGAVGQATATVAGLVNADAQREEAKQQALAKLNEANRDETIRNEKAQVQLETQRQRFAAQSEDISRRRAEEAIKQIEDLEKNDVWSAVNSLTPEQLKSASAFNLGFRSPEAMRAVNKAIGQRRAILDLPRLQTQIATDFSKSGSDHLTSWLSDNKLEGDEANLAYVEVMTTRLADDLASRQRREAAVEAQNNEYLVYDGLSHFAATKFDVATKADIEGKLREGYAQVLQTNPTISQSEYLDKAVGSMESALVGPETRFTATEVLTKFRQIFETEDQIEASGFGGVYNRAKNLVLSQAQDESENLFKLAKRQIEAAPGHSAVSAVMQAAKSDPRLNGLQRQELQLLADDRLAEPDYKTDVQQRYAGDRSIAMTPAHDKAIASFFADKESNPNYTTADRLIDSATRFGRILQQDVDAINGLVYSGDTREAVNRFATIREANPSLARSLEGKVSDKAYSLSLLASLGVVNADQFVAEFEGVGEDAFATARSVIENEKTESGEKLDRLVSNSVVGLARKAAGTGSSGVMDASVSETYEQLVYAGIARTIAAEGKLKPEELLERGEAFASSVLRRHVGKVELGDDSYVLTSQSMRSFGFAEAGGQYLKNVSKLWRMKQNELEQSFGGDVLLDFSEATTIDKDGRQFVSVPIRVRDQLLGSTSGGTFEFPKNSVVELKKLLDSEERRRDPDRPRSESERRNQRLFMTGGGAAP